MKAYLTYALDKEGNLVHVDNVPNGNLCNCICPHCKSELCAKNGGTGEKMIHHFSHLSGADCKGAIESALHKMAKDVMKKELCIQLPDRLNGQKGELLRLDKVDVEFYDKKTGLRPDCVGYYGDKVIWIEFKRTHAVDAKKKGKIISARIDCVELDINGCDLDPDAVRKFITEDSFNRIWIRDTISPPRKIGLVGRYGYVCDDDHSRVRRLVAFDENGVLVNLSDDEFDMNSHRYYCVVCGKELTIDVDDIGSYSFAHFEENAHCKDVLYLHKAAKEIILWRFNNSNDFEIQVPQYHNCDSSTSCALYNPGCCFGERGVPYNLKFHGYDECIKNYCPAGLNNKCDLVVKKKGSDIDAIIISINVGDCYINVDTDQYRIIEFFVWGEDSLYSLMKKPINEKNAKFINFKKKNYGTLPRSEINRLFLKFFLYSSGKYHLCEVSCEKLNVCPNSTVLEYVFDNSVEEKNEVKIYSLLKCYDQKLKACYCEICFFLGSVKSHFGMKKICKRYKTKGTPQFPLEVMPIGCPYFSIDNNIEKNIKLTCQNIKMIE